MEGSSIPWKFKKLYAYAFKNDDGSYTLVHNQFGVPVFSSKEAAQSDSKDYEIGFGRGKSLEFITVDVTSLVKSGILPRIFGEGIRN